ncbi:MAG: C1 family peptidase [Polyangiaceae bacterium]
MAHGQNHVIRKADGRERRLLGYKHAPPPSNASRYAASRVDEGQLPAKVDLRPHLSPVEDQGGLNSCVANAVAGAYEYLTRRHLGQDGYDVSRLFVYYNARAQQGMEEEDEGSVIADAIESLREMGACSENTWPYAEDIVNERPSDEAYDQARGFLVESSDLVETDLGAWKHALAEGYPIIFGCELFDSFDSGRKGKIPMPSPRERQRAEHGGHAMLCVGYSDPDRVFIVRNSWGERWGDRGYCYMPFDYLMSSDFNSGDSWILRRLDHFEVDETTWSNDEESILLDVASALGNMSDDEFGALLDAMGDTPFELRLALIMLTVAGADQEISEPELATVGEYVAHVLASLGADAEVEPLLHAALELIGDQELLEETIQLFGELLPADALASVVNDAVAMAAVDGLDRAEEAFAHALVNAWQVG